MHNFGRAWRLLFNLETLWAWIIAACLSIAEFYVAFAVGNVTSEHGLRSNLLLLLGLALLIFVGRTVIAGMQSYYRARTTQRVQRRLLAAIANEAEQETDRAEDLHFLTVEAQSAASTFLETLTDMVAGCFSLLAALLYGLTISWSLTLAMVVLCLAGVFVPKLTAKSYHGKQDDMQARSAAAQDVFVNFMAGRSVFNAFHADDYALDYFHRHFAEYTQAQYAAGVSRVQIETVGMEMGFLFDIVILGVELLFVGLGQITIFQYAALAILTPNYTWLFYSFPSLFASFIEGLTPAVRIQTVLERPTPSVVPTNSQAITSLTAQDVSFHYADSQHMVLKNLQLHLNVASSEKLLISGESGGGKTTLLKLLLAEQSATSGSITVETASGVELPLTTQEVAYVPQENTLIAGSFRDNVLLGRPVANADYKRILVQVGLTDLDAKYTADSGESLSLGGLSAGQLQKLGIARALLSERPILLMDEPFANLDEASKVQIANILKQLDTALIVVSHQFDFAAFWDRHLVLSSGALTECE
jgi:ABC-type bacteriocin/lantibiotic exporter with double-glycine peptidase domain